MRRLLPLIALALLAPLLRAGEPNRVSRATQDAAAAKELEPRPVAFVKSKLTLSDALAQIAAQTGNRIVDQRRQPSNPMLELPGEPTTFWRAVDALGKASGIGISPYAVDGSLALVDGPYRAVPVAYAGLFRIAVRRVATTRNEDTGTHLCQLALDVAWEPRFRPFYVELRQAQLTFAPDARQQQLRVKVPAQGPAAAAGRTALELDVQAAAPDRTCPRLDLLAGEVWAVGPSRMLSFHFDKLAGAKPADKTPPPVAKTQDGVTVTLASLRRQAEALLVTVVIDNPKDSPGFESHQTWLDNNRIVLSSGTGAKRRTLTPTGSREELRGRGARIVYEFAESDLQRLPATLDGWTLDYDTPGRIVELTVPFTLKDIPLP